MSYDEGLAQRIREVVADRQGVTERKMFGGLAFLLNGNMFCGIAKKEDLMVRVGPARHEEALREPHARLMDFAGKPMVGFIFVAPPGHASDEALTRWVDWSLAFVSPMPSKTSKPVTKKPVTKKPVTKKPAARKSPKK